MHKNLFVYIFFMRKSIDVGRLGDFGAQAPEKIQKLKRHARIKRL